MQGEQMQTERKTRPPTYPLPIPKPCLPPPLAQTDTDRHTDRHYTDPNKPNLQFVDRFFGFCVCGLEFHSLGLWSVVLGLGSVVSDSLGLWSAVSGLRVEGSNLQFTARFLHLESQSTHLLLHLRAPSSKQATTPARVAMCRQIALLPSCLQTLNPKP